LKPETERYLDKARQSLNKARAVAGIELAEAAGRAAYLAMFDAAQALIFERSAKVPRTRIAGFTLNFRGLLRMNRVLASSCRVIYHKLMISKPSPIMKLGRMRCYRSPKPSPRSIWPQSSSTVLSSVSNNSRSPDRTVGSRSSRAPSIHRPDDHCPPRHDDRRRDPTDAEDILRACKPYYDKLAFDCHAKSAACVFAKTEATTRSRLKLARRAAPLLLSDRRYRSPR